MSNWILRNISYLFSLIAAAITAFLFLPNNNYPIVDDLSIIPGVHYTEISNPITNYSKNHVLYYFWYDCPYCIEIDIKNIINTIPEAEFEIKHSGKGRFHEGAKIYNALKITNREVLIKPESIADISELMGSAEVAAIIAKDEELRVKLGLSAVPAMLVGNKYIINFQYLAGNNKGIPVLIRHLINKDDEDQAKQ
jgi:hypothetical protein